MAIDQVKTINELERLPQVEDSNAFAASTGGATGSVTANQIMEYMKQYLESLSNKSTTLTESDSQYPTCNAVSKETTRITNIMNSFISDLNNYNSYQQEVLFEGKCPSGDITLNQPFTNFPFIIIAYGPDSANVVISKIFSTKNLDYLLRTSDVPVGISEIHNYWYIETYAKGTTTTLLKLSHENSVINSIYGLKFKAT
nr:MAG TPA: hypothetical protein [Caudoviricetes sp.]